MFKKIKTVMMIILVIGMTMLMSSAGCDNAADSGGGSGGGKWQQPILKTVKGSTMTITHDTSKGKGYGTFNLKIVADDRNTFPYSEISGIFELDTTDPSFDPNAPDPHKIKFTVSGYSDVSMIHSGSMYTELDGHFFYDYFRIHLYKEGESYRDDHSTSLILTQGGYM